MARNMSDKFPPKRPGPKKPSSRKPGFGTEPSGRSPDGKSHAGKTQGSNTRSGKIDSSKRQGGKPLWGDSARSKPTGDKAGTGRPTRGSTDRRQGEQSGSGRAPWDKAAPDRKDRVAPARGKPTPDEASRSKSTRSRPTRGPARPVVAEPAVAPPPAPPAPHIDGKDERIAKLLARAGIASRREIERMIEDRRIALDGVVLETPATILSSLRGVTVDGEPVAAPERTRLFRFHKPSGLLTAERDHSGRPTIYNALRNALPPGAPRLMPIGRLDLNTEGLLLLTNDGELKRLLELPSTGVPRTYRARTFGDISQNQLEELIHGITIEGVHYGRIDANLERRTGRNQWIELTLTEGKNREVRRVLEHLGLAVSRLMRTSYGPFVLEDLARGAAVEVHHEELARFQNSLRPRANNRKP